MTLVRQQGDEVIAQFVVPTRGTMRSIAAHTVPTDAVYDSLNVFVREGKLRNRPGLSLLSDRIFLEPIIGGFQVVTPLRKTILGITRNRVYQLTNTSNIWTQVSPPGTLTMAPSDDAVVDMAFIETAGEYIAIMAEEHNVLKKWTAAPNLVVTLTGTNIPTAKSVTTAASRIVALVLPHTIVWSKTLNPADFDSLAVAKRAQTGDFGICVKSLSALSFVLYKERSIHLARAQACLDEGTAFAFSEPIIAEGPAGIYAVVSFNGMHIYMTKSGRVALFDGSSYPRWIADGLWLYLQDDIEPTLAYKIRGVYDYRLHCVIFFYPKRGSDEDMKGMVIINLPLEGVDIPQIGSPYYAFLGICEKPVSHACEKRFDDTVDRSLLFTAQSAVSDIQAFILDENAQADGSLQYDCMFQTGLQSMPDARHTFPTVESFIERSFGYGSVKIEPVISDSLDTPAGTTPDLSEQFINLESNPVREYTGFGYQVRFFGLRYSWRSDNTVRYSGTVLYGNMNNKYKKS